MTTIKEYKEMMEGATDAPWRIDIEEDPSDERDCHQIVGLNNSIITDDTRYYPSAPCKEDADFIVASVNIAPELIRVIELAEELTLEIQQKRHVDFDKVSNLREEIRKLKGE